LQFAVYVIGAGLAARPLGPTLALSLFVYGPVSPASIAGNRDRRISSASLTI
jgi:hypothetical protein